MYFLALSHEPPELEADIAICTPDTITPAKYPETDLGPNKIPKVKGVKITISPGKIISFKEYSVEIETHLLLSGFQLGLVFLSFNCSLTSST
jgi:hypothetical protein